MKNDKKPLREKTMAFAIRMVNLFRYLSEEKKEYVISKQILRSGTNPGAMIREAENAVTPADFIYKLGIAQKEIAETEYWLELLFRTEYISEKEYKSVLTDLKEIMKMLRSSILTKKQNMGENR